jgi:hypothetical protein
MARGRRLFDRLEKLEREYRSLIAKVCRDKLDRKFSKAAVRALMPGLFDGKLWRNEEAARLEYLEKEVRGLRHKLSLPLGESPIADLDQLRDEFGRRGDGGRRRLLEDFIAQQSSAVGRAM